MGAQSLRNVRPLQVVHTSNKVWIEITFGDSLKQYYGLPPWMSTA